MAFMLGESQYLQSKFRDLDRELKKKKALEDLAASVPKQTWSGSLGELRNKLTGGREAILSAMQARMPRYAPYTAATATKRGAMEMEDLLAPYMATNPLAAQKIGRGLNLATTRRNLGALNLADTLAQKQEKREYNYGDIQKNLLKDWDRLSQNALFQITEKGKEQESTIKNTKERLKRALEQKFKEEEEMERRHEEQAILNFISSLPLLGSIFAGGGK